MICFDCSLMFTPENNQLSLRLYPSASVFCRDASFPFMIVMLVSLVFFWVYFVLEILILDHVIAPIFGAFII